MTRVLAASVGAVAIVACVMMLGAAGRLPDQAVQALASVGINADYVDPGVRIVPPSAASSSGEEGIAEDTDGSSKTDFEGDEVSPALATYGIDRDGNLFEVHSPHTEVPRLPGPTI